MNGKIIVVLAALVALGAAGGMPAGPCNRDACPPALCADPVRPEGECCDTCVNSSCQYRGCVQFGAFGAQWYPNPCTLCQCIDGEERCGQMGCSVPTCSGFPLTTDPDACCPRCDYGIAADECAPIPVAKESLYASLGYGAQCRYEVTRHRCDKAFLVKDGEVKECVARKQAIPVVTDCENIRMIILEDVTQCTLETPRGPIADFDLNLKLCSLRV